jgi:CheY-like chemotaxis protein
MREGEEFEFELPADHGDLVSVEGYDGRLFMVIAYQMIRNCLPEEEYNEIVYEVIDAYTGEFLEADGEDVEFVTDADHAAAYVRENPNPKAFAIDTSHLENKGAEVMAKEERKPTARELSSQIAKERKAARKKRAEQIDRLLDEMNDYKRLQAEFGDAEYGDRIFAIEAELKKLTETD